MGAHTLVLSTAFGEGGMGCVVRAVTRASWAHGRPRPSPVTLGRTQALDVRHSGLRYHPFCSAESQKHTIPLHSSCCIITTMMSATRHASRGCCLLPNNNTQRRTAAGQCGHQLEA